MYFCAFVTFFGLKVTQGPKVGRRALWQECGDFGGVDNVSYALAEIQHYMLRFLHVQNVQYVQNVVNVVNVLYVVYVAGGW